MSKLDRYKLVLTAIDFIENNLMEGISVQEVCNQVPLSSWEFQRLFRAFVGNSIGSYLRGRRLTLAADILVHSEMGILDVAVDLQFGSQEAFTRAFKRQFKVSPGAIRKNPQLIKLYKKPRIIAEKLSHFQVGIQRAPKICNLGPLNLMGMETNIISFLGEHPDFERKLPEFWKNFERAKKKHSLNLNAVNYGVALSASEDMFEEDLKYFAGIPTSISHEIPSGFVTLNLGAQLYAVFENIGLADKSLATIDYIYGIWLPESGYRRAKGYDFEIFDDRYTLTNPMSISQYCIPIELS